MPSRRVLVPVVLVLAGLVLVVVGSGVLDPSPPPPNIEALDASSATPARTPTASATDDAPESPSPDEASPDTVTSMPSPGADKPVGIDPARIEIPAIGVDAPIVDLRLTADEVEVPSDFDDVGWWTPTRRPGEIGPSVMGGHVDSRSGPAVFFRLTELGPGDEILVHDADGGTRTFVVDRAIQADKYERPPEVFGFGEARPELRLITCGGEFDPSIGHYEDNYVVFAHQVEPEVT